ncbi:MAG TPA: hypothetical protein ENN07_02215 [candidate division Zixibacteria bacterium]|nr:hypothetical protein [candidate division Zixibacteria bacterium]
MFAWIIIIVAIAVFQVLSVSNSFPEIYTYLSTILLFLAALGFLYRAHIMKKAFRGKHRDHKLLGQILRQAGICTPDKILAALNNQSEGDQRRIGEILIEMGSITQEQLEEALKIQREKK